MARWLPPLNAIRAFEAAARHQSFTRAAAELSVTQGAVSHQVKALEASLGLKLFTRGHPELRLTPPGRVAFAAATEALDRLAQGFSDIRRGRGGKRLTVSVSPNFAAKWLVHRIGRFLAEHPEVDLRISAGMHHVDFAAEEVDIAVRHGNGDWPALHVTQLAEEELFPVCHPDLMRGKRPMRKPQDLARQTLIHQTDRRDWNKWLIAHKVTGANLERGPVYHEASLAIDAAIDGQGVTLARTALAAFDLLNGRLVRPFQEALNVDYAYWIVCPKTGANRPLIRLFRDWLLSEAARDATGMAKLLGKAGAGPSRQKGKADR